MTPEKILLLTIGVVLIFLALKSFVFFFKGGGFEMGVSPAGTRSLRSKNEATRQEQISLALRALLFFIIGVALIYTNIP